MKKGLISLIIPLLLFTACTGENNKLQEGKNVEQPKPVEQNIEVRDEALDDYYPFKENVEYVYAGEGNEYAAQDVYITYLKDNRMQRKVMNGGTSAAEVIEKTKDAITLIGRKGEVYHREDLTDMPKGAESEILIKTPLEVGNTWTIPNGHKRTITAIDKAITTPYGELKALEVTTEGKDAIVKDYYAKGIGPVKRIYTAKADKKFIVTTEIKEVNENTPMTEDVRFFYIKSEPTDFVLVNETKKVKLKTNEDIKKYFEQYMKTAPNEELTHLISRNTKIQKMGIDSEKNIAYIDLSDEFIDEMNAGSSVESMILEGIANTVGAYYAVDEVLLTVDGETYTSGHIKLEKDETLKVNLDELMKIPTI